MVHRRELGGEAIWFGNQGGLWGNAMTWFDHATGSVWSQPLGLAIAGPRRGQRLDLLPLLDRAPLTAPQQHVALRRSGATTSRGDRRAEP
jgi:hypothetical protein